MRPEQAHAVKNVVDYVSQQYDAAMLLAAYLLSVVICLTLLYLVPRQAPATLNGRLQWQGALGLIVGLGIWTSHLVFLLSWQPFHPTPYVLLPAGVSALVALAGAVIAIALALPGPRRSLTLAGVVTGVAISFTHYHGLQVTRPGAFATPLAPMLSALVAAILLSVAGFHTLTWRERWQGPALMVGALCLAGAVAVPFAILAHASHALAMAPVPGVSLPHTQMTIAVAATGSWIASLCLAMTVGWQLIARHGRREARHLGQLLQAEETIRRLTHRDPLTGLANAISLNNQLRQHIAGATRQGNSLAILVVGLDQFRLVNQMHGHDTGNRILVRTAERLLAIVQPSDTVARLHGDEFAVVHRLSAGPHEAARLAREIIDRVGRGSTDAQPVRGASIGIALYPADGQTPEQLIDHAQSALGRAKQNGGSAFQFFEVDMEDRMRRRHKLERELQVAMDQDQLELHYQPLVNGRTGRVGGYEALLRWPHPELGMVPPTEFIALAEESGLIVPLGRWVLARACRDACHWPVGRYVAVNLSPAQFRSGTLAHDVARILNDSGLPAGRLELEITENLLIQNVEDTLRVLQALKRQGIQIALDDFGTGYSSLGYLRRFPFDKLKIDISFVRDLGHDEAANRLCQAIVAMARSLRLTVTAEGVETQMQRDMLHSMQCDELQGYLLARPMPAADVADYEAWMEHTLAADNPSETASARARALGEPATSRAS